MPRPLKILAHAGAAVAALLLAGAVGLGSRSGEAALVLLDILSGDRASGLKTRSQPPLRASISWNAEGMPLQADLYVPAGFGAAASGGTTAAQAQRPGPVFGRPGSALLVMPGVTPYGRDDRHLVAFATSLARAGFRVMVPDLPNLRQLRVTASDADKVAAAIDKLSALHGGPVGVVGISYAIGPALLAAARPEIGRKVGLALAIGGYYDSAAVIGFFTTGQYRDPETGGWWLGAPHPLGKWVFAESNADRLKSAADRDLLRRIAERQKADVGAEVADLAGKLGPEGRAVLALLDNRDPDAVPRLIGRLPEGIRADIAAMSLAGRDLSGIAGRAVIIHGRTDPIIPSGESLRLAAAIGPARSEIYLLDGLTHAVAAGNRGFSIHDGLAMLSAMVSVLRFRDEGALAITAASKTATVSAQPSSSVRREPETPPPMLEPALKQPGPPARLPPPAPAASAPPTPSAPTPAKALARAVQSAPKEVGMVPPVILPIPKPAKVTAPPPAAARPEGAPVGTRPETSRPETSRPESSRPESSRPQTSRPQGVRQP